tara:strand:- start:1913 stop:2212 length:300 start_codon:yes stop_codon:yes gene_type:complete
MQTMGDALQQSIANGEVADTSEKIRERFNSELPVLAIDAKETMVVDDALSYEKKQDGTEWIYVHITDVSRWITQGGKEVVVRNGLSTPTTIFLNLLPFS